MITEQDFLIALAFIFIVYVLMRRDPELNKPAPQTGVISGGLTYNGSPVAAAAVTLYKDNAEVALAVSDDTGKFTLPAVAVGTYHLTAILKNADGTWLQADQDIDLQGDALIVDLAMVCFFVSVNYGFSPLYTRAGVTIWPQYSVLE